MKNATFTYRVLVKDVNEQGETVYKVSQKALALPEGGCVTDPAKLAAQLTEALESIYHDELASAETKAANNLRKVQGRADEGKATAEDVAKALAKYHDASKKYASYPAVSVCGDKIAKFLGYAITATRLVKIDEAGVMLSLLRTPSATVDRCTEEIQLYFNDRFNLRAEKCEYLKPYRTKLKAKQVENLRKVAQCYTMKWTEKGIEERYMNEMKLWQQVVLNILADAFKLRVEQEKPYDTV